MTGHQNIAFCVSYMLISLNAKQKRDKKPSLKWHLVWQKDWRSVVSKLKNCKSFVNLFQVLNNQLQQVLNKNNNQRQPSVVIEETIMEDATFPEQVAQEITIKDGTVTHIGAGPYNGFVQGS